METSVLCSDSVVLCWLELLRDGLGRVEDDILYECGGCMYKSSVVCIAVGLYVGTEEEGWGIIDAVKGR